MYTVVAKDRKRPEKILLYYNRIFSGRVNLSRTSINMTMTPSYWSMATMIAQTPKKIWNAERIPNGM